MEFDMQDDLQEFFSPKSIAVIGATEKPNSVGMKVFKNLIQGGYRGTLYAVNPKHIQVLGRLCFPSVARIQEHIDLAIIVTPAKTVADIVRECGEKGIHAVLILSSGFSETGSEGKSLEKSILEIAKQFHIRIIGPNCLGIMRPSINMNATFDNNTVLPGHLALVSQSGAICAGIVDWAINKKIGFSTIISSGNNADVNFADILYFLAHDPLTESILMYIEGVRNATQFMEALRLASRLKPVIALKAGKNLQGSRAALSHTGALIGSDEVFDVALRRAGAVRVMKMEDLFTASEVLIGNGKVKGNRLTIITNGGGAGVLAADRASELNIALPALSEEMVAQLNQVLPAQWSHQNPIDIIGDATPERYHDALQVCANYHETDGILAMLVPVSMSKPFQVAEQIIEDAKKIDKFIMTSWIGDLQVRDSWELFSKHQIPCFDTPEKAVEAFSYLVDYHHNQQLLQQTVTVVDTFKADIAAARSVINAVLSEGRNILSLLESKFVLKQFGIPVTETIVATTVNDAINAAKTLGFPVVMKIHSPDITHKASAGGVILNITNQDQVINAFDKIMQDVKSHNPNAKIQGVTVEPQLVLPAAHEVMIGVMNDIVFGPVISVGAGGSLVEIIQDKALALPPLNQFIASNLISQTRIMKSHGKYVVSAKQTEAVIAMLLAVSNMVCELPEIQEMDINPVIVSDEKTLAVDARIIVKQVTQIKPYSHLAIKESICMQ